MNNKKCRMETTDALDEVVSKLCAIRDFMQVFDDNFCMHKSTPVGLSVIIGDCINSLNQIGGSHDQPQD